MSDPVFVNSGAWQSVTGTSFTLNLPGSRVNGNILLAATSVASSRTPTWSAGWTPIGAGNEFAWAPINGSETAPTVSWTGSSTQAGVILQYGPVNVGSPVGATRENQAQTGTSATCNSITTVAGRSLVVALILANTSVPTNPTGFTSDTTTSGGGSALRAASVLETAIGSASPSVTSTVTNGIWRVTLIELESPINGTLSVTEANDTISAGGAVAVVGTLSKTETNDTISAAGVVLVVGTLLEIEADDTLVAHSDLVSLASLIQIEGDDILLAAGRANQPPPPPQRVIGLEWQTWDRAFEPKRSYI